MIRLGLELSADERWVAGILYVRNLIYCLASLPPEERPIVRLLGLSSVGSETVEELRSFDFVDSGMPSRLKFVPRWGRYFIRGCLRINRKLFGVSRMPNWEGVDVVYPGFGLLDIKGAVYMRWIPDFQHFHMPHLFSKEELEARREAIRQVAYSKGIVVISSRTALEDFRTIHPDATVTPRIWPFCSVLTKWERTGRNPHEAYGLPEKYLYLPNQFWVHKDHKTAFQAVALLKKEGIDLPLVCTGYEHDHRRPDHLATLKAYLSEANLSEHVRLLGLIPRNDQIEIFRHSAAVLQPSLFEGWSTAVEDAKAVGRPIIASDLPVHYEQLQGLENIRFFRRSSAEHLAEVVGELWPMLPPGPDLAAEQRATARTEKRRLAAARAFMDIASEAIALHRDHCQLKKR
jgi:glycosyltransferase involved in cell wall biosynthesis